MSAPARAGELFGARLAAKLTSFRLALTVAALALPLTGVTQIDDPLELPSAISVFAADFVVALALLAWVLGRFLAPPHLRPGGLLTPLLGWPLLALFAALLPGIVRGHERYGSSLIGQPLRLVLYAGIAAALVDLAARDVFRLLVAVFYTGAVWQLALAAYHLAMGTSATEASVLSTGGTRVLALGTGMYLLGALVLALLNLERATEARSQLLHGTAGAVAFAGVVLTFGRTTFLAGLLILIALAATLRRTRRTLLHVAPVAVPALALVAFVVLQASPEFEQTLQQRLGANPLEDRTFRWRLAAIEASLSGLTTDRPEAGGGVFVAAPAPSYRGNQPLNGTFEEGVEGWSVQGGEITSVAETSVFGSRSMKLVTMGTSVDEGAYSAFFAASRGEVWTFTAWLQGRQGGEQVNLSIWEYGESREGEAQANLPLILTRHMKGYVIRRQLAKAQTTQIRALIRTRLRPQAVTIYVDGAHLQREAAPPELPPPSAGEQDGVPPRLAEQPPTALNRVTGPILGLGFGRATTFVFDGLEYQGGGDPHNGFVYLLAGGGILALGGFIVLVGVFVRDAVRRLHTTAGVDRLLLVWSVAMWAILMVNALTGIIFTEPQSILALWAIMLLPALVRPAPAALAQKQPGPRDLSGRLGRAGGEDDGESATTAAGSFTRVTVPRRRRTLRQRASALFRRDHDDRSTTGEGDSA
jgi:O-antigen ligase